MNRIVTTESGQLRGQIEQDASVFRGVPYAAAPSLWVWERSTFIPGRTSRVATSSTPLVPLVAVA
jgi:carboxylesterase type B